MRVSTHKGVPEILKGEEQDRSSGLQHVGRDGSRTLDMNWVTPTKTKLEGQGIYSTKRHEKAIRKYKKKNNREAT